MPAPFNTTIDYVGTVRGRVGYAFGTLDALCHRRLRLGAHPRQRQRCRRHDLFRRSGTSRISAGPRALGVEFAVGGNWTAKAEYDYIDLARRTYDLSGFRPAARQCRSQHSPVQARTELPAWRRRHGLDRRRSTARTALPESDDWNVHGQTTCLPQGYPRDPLALCGHATACRAAARCSETWTTTAFLGVRLWQGGEFYFNPELAQGFGLNGTLGLAGFSNGEAQKAGAPFPKIRPQRYYLPPDLRPRRRAGRRCRTAPNQLAGKRDIDRVTLIVGRFAVGDFFDGNSYAKDPRADFMNWAMWSSAAYDFPADLPGYTRGAVVELNRKDWAVRAGLFQVPTRPTATC